MSQAFTEEGSIEDIKKDTFRQAQCDNLELLGHNSSKTTEIYTHFSTKSMQQIKSPFDDL